MKVTEYILERLAKEGVRHAFGITGGVIVPLVDAFDKEKNLEFVCTTQEQGAAMAAEAYARITGNLGVTFATSGPGATNLITGIGCSYFDSIPTLHLTGQVDVKDTTYPGGPRQIGFQETDIVKIVEPITKYSKRVDDHKDIKYELDKAIHIAKSGRPGPVLLDLPINMQLEDINPDRLISYVSKEKQYDYETLDKKVDETIRLINNAKRPIIIIGAGVKLAKYVNETRSLIERLEIPVTPSWGAMDILHHDHELFVGGFGVSANRAGNFAVQNSDLILSIGSRLDTRQTGAKADTFARKAKKIVVDIDENELYKKRGMEIDVDINYNLRDFVNKMQLNIFQFKKRDLSVWKNKINEWKEKYPIVLLEYYRQKDKVNPYVFMQALSGESKEGDIIISDAGANLTWTMQGFKIKKDQKLFSAFGNSPMAYSFPASIGASIASNNGPITCIIGDGGLKMNINELETVVRYNLPIKTFLINNHEFGIIKQFQDVWFKSRYKASDVDGGLGNSDLLKIARAYGMATAQINNHNELGKIKEVLDYEGPILCSVELRHGEYIVPKLEFGKSIEDPTPFLNREEFRENMIIEPLD